ncbi:YbaB/EbfC family nucleoid-associated protein [Kribbella sandramycini]|uniref:DNA-binding protein YbaB n=1 Tax=Kribbella sandramycini TaxID=60450 RepID=A0A7Y4KXT4_9ACTN|nr:YbaB/EbfC family nucleoid-associated protein [Kribbella sandramycini]MBB6569566.1 DNA-binding protein YbaB [Kribbella sandramycini]NOL40600.1 YbaB/EbfC family nucleoid-associated protein [Kribbella sandramycini]
MQFELADELAAIQRQLDDVRATADSPNGLVAATVDGRGRVCALDLDARIYRTHDTAALAGQILAAIERAGADAADQAGRVARRVLGIADPDQVADPAFDVPRRILGGVR